ncbi:hypothetical protein [Acrocarpospora catenulata]|uniref:hypothetical protein n=1 Tax=Acrocarpospora catenulata TaxID=2836182 RepID=UPI001BD95E50|nr:hypothetical protein [Acrocarpospora catenulata]
MSSPLTRLRFLRLRLTALLALLALAAAVAAGWLYTDLGRLQAAERAAREGGEAARAYAADMLSYDYRSVEEDLARARGHATGALAEQYRRLAGTLVPEAKKLRKVQQAEVDDIAVESATPEEVRVLVFLNMTTTSPETGGKGARQEVAQNRARLVMVPVGNRWLVADLSTLLGNTPIR